MCDISTITIPAAQLEWSTKEFFTKILHKYSRDKEAYLVNFTVANAVAKGANYISDVYRARLDYNYTSAIDESTETVSFIIKSCLEDSLVNELMEELNVFQREAIVYDKIIPECYNLLKNINEPVIFAPKVYLIEDRLIVLEDLSLRDYKTKDRKFPLDENHCKVILRKLAIFHAATAMINQGNPDLMKYHKKGNITEVETSYHAFYKNAIAASIKHLQTVPKFEKYASKLQLLEADFISHIIEVFTRNENSFNCLNHGDVWTNNVMFKEADKIEDFLFVDFQEGFYGSPAIDLHYFIYTSCSNDIKLSWLDNSSEILKYYHEILIKTLQSLNYKLKLPSLDELRDDIKQKYMHAITSTFCILPILLIENIDYADPINFIAEGDDFEKIRDEVYSNPKLDAIYEDIVSKLCEDGLL